MEVAEAIKNRKSIRAFKVDQVPDGLLESIFKKAIQSPSAKNIQPWEFTVINAKTARKIGRDLGRMLANHVPINPDISVSKEWGGIYKSRARELGKALFSLLGIQRDDRESRRSHYLNIYVQLFRSAECDIIYLHG